MMRFIRVVSIAALLIAALSAYSAFRVYNRNWCAASDRISQSGDAVVAAKRLIIEKNLAQSFPGGSQNFVNRLSVENNCCGGSKEYDFGFLSNVWTVVLNAKNPAFSALVIMNECGTVLIDSGTLPGG
jgi:hypothetical protein